APRVLERLDLGGGLGAVLLGEEDVVVLVGLEGRIEIDEVDGLVLDVAAQYVEVVAVEQEVLGHCGVRLRVGGCPKMGRGGDWAQRCVEGALTVRSYRSRPWIR